MREFFSNRFSDKSLITKPDSYRGPQCQRPGTFVVEDCKICHQGSETRNIKNNLMPKTILRVSDPLDFY